MKSLRAEYGLDQPLPVQLWKYVNAVAHGDLGTSYVRASAGGWRVILERLPNTLLLDAFALLVAAAGGHLARQQLRRGVPVRPATARVTVLSMLFYAVPQFWLGMNGGCWCLRCGWHGCRPLASRPWVPITRAWRVLATSPST